MNSGSVLKPTIDSTASSRLLAILGGAPAFDSNNPVPQIFPTGYGHTGEHDAVTSILRNEPSSESKQLLSRQGYVSKTIFDPNASHRSTLQRCIKEFLGLHHDDTKSVVTLTSGTNALRAALKAVCHDQGGSKTRNEVIIPATTVTATAHAVITEGFVPVITDVDPNTWMLSPKATAENLSDKTAAIITVDWLGTCCDLHPFRKLADKHGVKLISDSAQSFGATRGKPSSVDVADAVIYSTGFPKVFQTGGGGGILICSPSQAEWLEKHPTGIFRHEAMPESNAYQGLRALDKLREVLDARAVIASKYRQLLSDTPGITFQRVPQGTGASHYQLSVTVDAEKFGFDAKNLCEALRAENLLCSTERMPCLGSMSELARNCNTDGGFPVSRGLSQTSITLPIFDQFTPDLCEKTCSLIKTVQKQSAAIIAMKKSYGTVLPHPQPTKPANDIIDIASKYRDYVVVRIFDNEKAFSYRAGDKSAPSMVLVPLRHLVENKISMDELHRALASKSDWSWGSTVIKDLIVHSNFGSATVLTPRGEGHSQILAESGSSAHVALVVKPNGDVVVRKRCSSDGIDGNGRPWLKRQQRFLEASIAVKKTDLFVKPEALTDIEGTVSMTFPHIPSHSLGEMVFAGMDPTIVVNTLADLVGEMSTCVWTEDVNKAPADFIEQAHFDRIERRVGIARKEVPLLDKVANRESITLNGRKLLGFNRILKALSQQPTIASIAPLKLSEIHGDLNIHNILCQLEGDDMRKVVLIDPRAVPLLDESAKNSREFELGDYCYDISKLKFSLSGFSEIRKGLYSFEKDGESFKLAINKNHPGSSTMDGADREFFDKLCSDTSFTKWVETVEQSGLESMKLRVLLGEAAHFVADSACALGRDKKEEVLPLFLMGIEKLNDVLEMIEKKTKPKLPLAEADAVAESSNHGARIIRTALLSLRSSSNPKWAWDVMEFPVKSESTGMIEQLLNELVGEYLPEGTEVHVSTHPNASIKFPCILIHPFDGVRGQTHAVSSSIRRTSEFLRDTGLSQEKIDDLRIVTVSSTGASTRSQFTARQNDKLLSPGPWGLSPLKLSVMQANQVVFPRSGRWVMENDSFFVTSQPLRMRGDGLCLLASKRPTTGSNSSWRLCMESMVDANGRMFATGFRDILPDETKTKLLRHTSAIFLPNHIGQQLAQQGHVYTTRASPLLIDIILPRFMDRDEWISLCHSQGFGVNSDLAWNTAKKIPGQAQRVELAYGGDEMNFRHFGSDAEYTKLVEEASSDHLLNSLAYVPSMARWLYP